MESGNFVTGHTRTSTTHFNPGLPNYPGTGWDVPSPTGPWVLETFDYKKLTAAQSVALRKTLRKQASGMKTVKNRLHLDVRPADGSDQKTELARLIELGARPVDIGQGDVAWHVLADPEGNEFCLLRSTPSQVAAILAARAAAPASPQPPD